MPIKNAKIEQGKSYGAIIALKSIADELGITKALGHSKGLCCMNN